MKEIVVREHTEMWPWPLDSTTDSNAAINKLPIPERKGGQTWTCLATTECRNNCSMLRVQSECTTGATQHLVDAMDGIQSTTVAAAGADREVTLAPMLFGYVLCVHHNKF